MNVTDILVWVLTGGGAGALAYKVIDLVPYLTNLQATYKRFASWGISAVLGIAAYFGLAWFGVWAGPTGGPPATAQEWVSALFWIAVAATAGSQTTHALTDLRKRPAPSV